MGKAELRIQIAADLLAQARAAGVELDQALEEKLRALISEGGRGVSAGFARQDADATGADSRARQWAQDNSEAIRAYNDRVARRGLFSDDLRRW